jgi:hypothetical protein
MNSGGDRRRLNDTEFRHCYDYHISGLRSFSHTPKKKIKWYGNTSISRNVILIFKYETIDKANLVVLNVVYYRQKFSDLGNELISDLGNKCETLDIHV